MLSRPVWPRNVFLVWKMPRIFVKYRQDTAYLNNRYFRQDTSDPCYNQITDDHCNQRRLLRKICSETWNPRSCDYFLGKYFVDFLVQTRIVERRLCPTKYTAGRMKEIKHKMISPEPSTKGRQLADQKFQIKLFLKNLSAHPHVRHLQGCVAANQ